jgi:DNA-directed RNA polymerase specialized sigma24 family protein
VSDHSINHPEVVAAIRGTLVKRGIAHQELEDAQHEVQMRALESLDDRGLGDPGIEKSKALGTTIASNYAIDEGRDAASQRNRDEKKQYPQAHAAPAERSGEEGLRAHVDHGRTVGEVRRMAQDGTLSEQEVDMLDALASGEKRAKIAQDLGKTPATLDNDVKRMRRKILSRLSVAAVSLLTMNVVWNRVVAEEYLKRHNVDVDGSTLSQTTHDDGRVRDTQEHAAAKLRQDAYAKCAVQDWSGCKQDLNLAYDVDPDGQSDPAVQDALWAIYNAQHAELKERQAKPPVYRGPVPQAPKK